MFIVICQDEGRYCMATSRSFETFEQACRYADSIAHDRNALVYELRTSRVRKVPPTHLLGFAEND